MYYTESLVLNFWRNPDEQLLQIEKEIRYPQIEEKRLFLEDYKLALLEFLDIFDSSKFLKERIEHIHIPKDDSESLAGELFREYSFWNHLIETYEVDINDELDTMNLYISNLNGLLVLQPQINKFLNLFTTINSNEEFIHDCIAHLSLSRSQVQFILSLSISQLKDYQQSINNDIVKFSAISEFLDRIYFGFWERLIEEENGEEVTFFYDTKRKEWERISEIELPSSSVERNLS